MPEPFLAEKWQSYAALDARLLPLVRDFLRPLILSPSDGPFAERGVADQAANLTAHLVRRRNFSAFALLPPSEASDAAYEASDDAILEKLYAGESIDPDLEARLKAGLSQPLTEELMELLLDYAAGFPTNSIWLHWLSYAERSAKNGELHTSAFVDGWPAGTDFLHVMANSGLYRRSEGDGPVRELYRTFIASLDPSEGLVPKEVDPILAWSDIRVIRDAP